MRCPPKFATLGRVAALAAAFIVLDAWELAAPAYFSGDGGNFYAQALARDLASAGERSGASRAIAAGAAAGRGRPHRAAEKGVTNIYAIGIAGWADRTSSSRSSTARLARLRSRPADPEPHGAAGQRSRTAGKRSARQPAQFCRRSARRRGGMDKDTDVLHAPETSHGDGAAFAAIAQAATSELTPQEVARRSTTRASRTALSSFRRAMPEYLCRRSPTTTASS